MCDHRDSIITDYHSADSICTSCGFVLEERMSFSHREMSSISHPPPTPDTRVRGGELQADMTMGRRGHKSERESTLRRQIYDGRGESHALELLIRENILDALATLHMEENSFLCDTAFNIFLELSQLATDRCGNVCHFGGGKIETLTLKRLDSDKSRAFLAFAIWESLNRQGTPKSPHVVSAICRVEPNTILRIEKIFEKGSTYCDLTSFITTECDRIYVPYRKIKLVISLIEHVKYVTFGRKPLVVFIAFLHSITCCLNKDKALPLQYSADRHFTSDYLCNKYNICQKSVEKIVKLIPEFNIVSNVIVFKN